MGGGQGEDNGQYAAVPNEVGMTPEDELAQRIIGVQDVNAYPNAFPAANSVNTGDSTANLNDQGTGVPKEASARITAEDILNVMRVFA
jgi:hypothetical protein